MNIFDNFFLIFVERRQHYLFLCGKNDSYQEGTFFDYYNIVRNILGSSIHKNVSSEGHVITLDSFKRFGLIEVRQRRIHQ